MHDTSKMPFIYLTVQSNGMTYSKKKMVMISNFNNYVKIPSKAKLWYNM